MNMQDDHDNNEIPEDIRGTCASLDALARDEASSAPAGLEDRLFVRTRASISGAGSDHAADFAAPPPPTFVLTPWLRLAAVLGLASIVVIVAVVVSKQGAVAPAPDQLTQSDEELELELGSALDELLEVASLESSPGLLDEIAALESALSTLESEEQWLWTLEDALTDEETL